MKVLSAIGSDLIQGYHFSKPVPASEIPELADVNFLSSGSPVEVVLPLKQKTAL